MIAKIWRVLRKEGPSGLIARWRYPTRDKNAAVSPPTFLLPLSIEGDKGPLSDALIASISLLAGDDAIDPINFKGRLHLSPSGQGPDFGPKDAVLFGRPESAVLFVGTNNRSGTKLPRDIANSAALLVPSVECFHKFDKAGVDRDKIFIVPVPADLQNKDVTIMAGDLARWLIAASTISVEDIDPNLFSVLRNLTPDSRLCLSMPETPERRSDFLRLGMNEFQLFNGIRKKPGWQGCGWSYATIAKAALMNNAAPLTVCEDDMIPGDDFSSRLNDIETYLQKENWDLFSGLLTDFPEDCSIHRVERHGALTFIHLDYSIGMVLNIYNRRALERLAVWKPENGDIDNNTVDAWLAATPGLRVITTLPFLAGHNAHARSTIFGFANKRYNSMIKASEKRLERLIAQMPAPPEV